MSKMLEMIGLTKVYRIRKGLKRYITEITALSEVRLEVRKGELFGLLGPNGAGKTTLIKVLCTLVLPTKGTAVVNGFDVVRERSEVAKSLGVMLPEMRGFYWRLKGIENLEIYARLYGLAKPKERTEEVLSIVGISKNDAEKRFQKYSSGMKQKLMSIFHQKSYRILFN